MPSCCPASRSISSSKAGRSRGGCTTPGIQVITGDPRRVDTYLKADISPSTCFIIEDNARRERQEDRLRDPRRGRHADLPAAHRARATARRRDTERAALRDVTHLELAELIRPTLVTELSRSMTRARVQQYQRYFADADRVLILLHNDPDPDALASGLALRNLLRRTKTTAIIGAMQGVTRPGEPAHGEHARHPGRAGHRRRRCRSSSASRRSTCSRTTSAGCSTAPTWSSTTIPSSRATAPCSRTSAPTTDRRPRS